MNKKQRTTLITTFDGVWEHFDPIRDLLQPYAEDQKVKPMEPPKGLQEKLQALDMAIADVEAAFSEAHAEVEEAFDALQNQEGPKGEKLEDQMTILQSVTDACDGISEAIGELELAFDEGDNEGVIALFPSLEEALDEYAGISITEL